MCYHTALDYFKKIRKTIFLNNICLTFNFSEALSLTTEQEQT